MKLNKEQEKMMLSIYGTYTNYYRSLRTPIFNAFDIYKSNVQYGIETETEEGHNKILEWYDKVLNLEVEAIENIPDKIKNYM